ncbi:hypothetical protein EDB86DRAFT_2937114, partial [Lactarius hatsudake]
VAAAANAHASGHSADEGATLNPKHRADDTAQAIRDGPVHNHHARRPFDRHSSGSEVVMVSDCHRVRDAARPDEDGAAEMVSGCRRADDGENSAEGDAEETENGGGSHSREDHPSRRSQSQNRKRWCQRTSRYLRKCRKTMIRPPTLHGIAP